MTADQYKELIKQGKDNPEAVGLILGKIEQEILSDLKALDDMTTKVKEQEGKIKDMGYQLWLTTTGKPEEKPGDKPDDDEDEDDFDSLLKEIGGKEDAGN